MREGKSIIIEKTPLGFLRKDARKALQNRSRQYKKDQRSESITKYKKGIAGFERKNDKLIAEILADYEG